MYDRILMPTDGSEGAEAALNHAESLAQKYDAELHILYVADIRAELGEPAMEFVVENLEEVGKEAVEAVADKVSDDIETVTEVVSGIPHREIRGYVGENDVDLITMGSHGRSGLDRLLIGSVAEKVIRTTDIPIMTVPVEE